MAVAELTKLFSASVAEGVALMSVGESVSEKRNDAVVCSDDAGPVGLRSVAVAAKVSEINEAILSRGYGDFIR